MFICGSTLEKDHIPAMSAMQTLQVSATIESHTLFFFSKICLLYI